MLSAVFLKPEIGEDRILRDLIRSFSLERPRIVSSTPSWDLNIVLKDLMSDKYEPLASKDLRVVTKKALFLTALATAKRVSELQAISKNVGKKGLDLILSYRPGFLAKTESIDNPLPRCFVLKSLRDFAGDLEEGPLLCPVRALLVYLQKVKETRGVWDGLFVSPRNPKRLISKNGLSYFLREVIVDAGAVHEQGNVRAHSIRGLSTSVAFLKNCSISKVLEAATWKSNSVFASFYFKDLAHEFGELKSLGPFVASGSLIK